MRHESAGIEKHRVPAHRPHERHAQGFEPSAQVHHRGVAIDLVVLLQGFVQPHGNDFQIAPRQPAVGGKALAQNQQVPEILRPLIVVAGEESADVRQTVLLAAHRRRVGMGKHLPCDVRQRLVAVALLVLLDEVGVLGKAAGVDHQRDAMPAQNRLDRAYIGHGHRLAAAGVVGHGHHAEGNLRGPVLVDAVPQFVQVHVALERRLQARLQPFGTDQVHRPRPDVFDVRPCGVEVAVVGDHVAGLEPRLGENALGRPALVRGENVLHARDAAHRALKVLPRPAARVALVAEHHGRPLLRGHRARAAVGQQVDAAVLSIEQKDVVMRPRQGVHPLLPRGQLQRLGHLDAKRLDDGPHVRTPWPRPRSRPRPRLRIRALDPGSCPRKATAPSSCRRPVCTRARHGSDPPLPAQRLLTVLYCECRSKNLLDALRPTGLIYGWSRRVHSVRVKGSTRLLDGSTSPDFLPDFADNGH